MSAPAGATHWVSGEFHERLAGTATLTSGRIVALDVARGLAANIERRPTLTLGQALAVRLRGGAWRRFEVISIERTVDDEGRVSPTGAAIVYLREVAR